MDLEILKNLFNYLFQKDNEFLEMNNEFIIDQGLDVVQNFMDERSKTIHSINSILKENPTTDKNFIIETEKRILNNTELLTKKCSVIQAEIKNRIIKSNKVKGAHQYFHNTQMNPIFIDKTV